MIKKLLKLQLHSGDTLLWLFKNETKRLAQNTLYHRQIHLHSYLKLPSQPVVKEGMTFERRIFMLG